jgi:tRNA A-37 threonylcarbamoyl transferase component Bud32
LEDWSADRAVLRELPVGPSRHLVRFVVIDETVYALKEELIDKARHEYEVLVHLEALGLPSVRAIGISERSLDGTAILVTEYLRHSLQYRRLLMRVPLTADSYRDRLLDAMASLLVDLHRGGIYWGDCSLANTLFRRDGGTIQAYLVDAETSETYAELSDGQRAYDLDVLVENVAFGLADLAAFQGHPEAMDDQIAAAESVRDRYSALWQELHDQVEIQAGDRFAIQAHIRRLNDLGFAIGEIELLPGDAGTVRLRTAVAQRDFHARELDRRTGLVALEGQARLLLNDLREYRAWLAFFEGRPVSSAESAARWQEEVLEPYLGRLRTVIGPGRDPLQAYCDLLEHKWLRSERAQQDLGLEAAFASYVAAGAPAPEVASGASALDLDLADPETMWAGGKASESRVP